MSASSLRLLADDADSLGVIAAAAQDGLVRPADISWNRKARAFGLEMNRFQWESAGRRAPWFRSRAVLALQGVLAVRSRALPRGVDEVLSVLDVRFEPAAEPPAGEIVILFSGGGEIRADVECLDVTLADTGPAWPTRRKPQHDAAREG
jgi:hypothetical protein